MFKFFNRYWLKPAVFTILGEVSLLTFSAWLAFRIRFWHRPEAYFEEPLTWIKILMLIFMILPHSPPNGSKVTAAIAVERISLGMIQR